jgi:hypothetical protein
VDTDLKPKNASKNAAATLRHVDWWGVYAFADTPPGADNFTIRLFTFIGGVRAQFPSMSLLWATTPERRLAT